MKNYKNLNMKYYLSIFCSLFLMSQTSFAYLSLSETAELIKKDHYRVGVATQLLLTNGSGTNYGAFFDMPVDDEMNARFTLGTGTTSFWTSGSIKWVPYPDYKQQPAIGIRGAIFYARDATQNFYDLQVTPIISKIVDSQWGKLNPYVGLPITLIYSTAKAVTAMQFVIGTEWIDKPSFQVGAEFGLNLSNSSSVITMHVNFPFDGNIGFRQ
ncbi:MAG: hypothetical protein AABY53_06925 [Bdellovibrionota bacterium]